MPSQKLKMYSCFSPSDGFSIRRGSSSRKATLVVIPKNWVLVEEFHKFNLWKRETECGDIIHRCFPKGIDPNSKNYYLV